MQCRGTHQPSSRPKGAQASIGRDRDGRHVGRSRDATSAFAGSPAVSCTPKHLAVLGLLGDCKLCWRLTWGVRIQLIACRNFQNEYERSGAEKFAAIGSTAPGAPSKRKASITGGFGGRVAETFRSLQELSHHDYDSSIPAAVHGAPQTVEVCFASPPFQHYPGTCLLRSRSNAYA